MFQFERYEFEKSQLVSGMLGAFERDNLDATQKESAEKIGVCPQTLKRLAEGRTKFPRFDTIWKLMRASGLSLVLEEGKKSLSGRKSPKVRISGKLARVLQAK